MKIIYVYPSVEINIQCPTCNFSEVQKFQLPPKEGFQIVCSKCNEEIVIKLNERQYYRKQVSIPVYYSLHDFDNISDTRVKSGWTVDISKTGIGIEISAFKYSTEYEKEGNIMTISFALPPKNKQIKVKGKIVRIFGDKKLKINMGIQFLNLDDYQSQTIGIFLMP
jgi:c-di-GMP-binding flagellar brake protein YcgR